MCVCFRLLIPVLSTVTQPTSRLWSWTIHPSLLRPRCWRLFTTTTKTYFFPYFFLDFCLIITNHTPCVALPLNGTTNRSLQWRRKQLNNLKRMVEENEGAIAEALNADLRRPYAETLLLELWDVLAEIKYFEKNLNSLARKEKLPTPLSMQPLSFEVQLYAIYSCCCLLHDSHRYHVCPLGEVSGIDARILCKT